MAEVLPVAVGVQLLILSHLRPVRSQRMEPGVIVGIPVEQFSSECRVGAQSHILAVPTLGHNTALRPVWRERWPCCSAFPLLRYGRIASDSEAHREMDKSGGCLLHAFRVLYTSIDQSDKDSHFDIKIISKEVVIKTDDEYQGTRMYGRTRREPGALCIDRNTQRPRGLFTQPGTKYGWDETGGPQMVKLLVVQEALANPEARQPVHKPNSDSEPTNWARNEIAETISAAQRAQVPTAESIKREKKQMTWMQDKISAVYLKIVAVPNSCFVQVL
ncbi:hypothetical protein FA15DRAFT_658952 [Coprinopsis marcescibilis]|uniref:Uncharacterized protein n=1 Tax=Coprinopsis marcescibilis TaxID=230819 RepID=A0A5C3KXC5_COPMA|nr:hypothetical protein FA15DRAFT_658952 [Coprinopsis marcescibilis]